MATKSILKGIHIKDKKQAAKLVSAMERALKQCPKKVEFSRMVTTADKDEIELLFRDRFTTRTEGNLVDY